MKPIPQKLKQEMKSDPFYSMCCLREISTCDTREGVQWHHHLQHEGSQVNEKFCILPLCPHHHKYIHLPKAKHKADKIMLERASDEQIEKYDLQQLKEYVENRDVPEDWE